MILINLFGGPGIGKSTAAAALYAGMSMRGINAELVGEAAKSIVWDECQSLLENQVLVTGRQYQRILRLVGKVDVAIADSPLILAYVYGQNLSYISRVRDLIWALEDDLGDRGVEVFNVVLKRDLSRPYQPNGRVQQTVEEAIAFDEHIQSMADPAHFMITSSLDGIGELADSLTPILKARGAMKP
jgi:hypothetical protein